MLEGIHVVVPITGDAFDSPTILHMYTNGCTIGMAPLRNVSWKVNFVRWVGPYCRLFSNASSLAHDLIAIAYIPLIAEYSLTFCEKGDDCDNNKRHAHQEVCGREKRSIQIMTGQEFLIRKEAPIEDEKVIYQQPEFDPSKK